MKRNVWLFSSKNDLLWLYLPVWICWVVCFGLGSEWLSYDLPFWVWIFVVLGIDVSHVWSTIFRTYLDKEESSHHAKVLKWAPIVGFLLSLGVALISSFLFWRLLAYLALFHFVKQQYGFMQLYKARYGFVQQRKFFHDQWVIYTSMLYPVLYWHLNDDRNFSWFVKGDFISLHQTFLADYLLAFNQWGTVLYFIILSGWLIEEFLLYRKNQQSFPIGKWIWTITTALNWYLGIIYFNSDIAFTLTNVVAHGIPYFVLVYTYTERKNRISHGLRFNIPRKSLGLIIVFGSLLLAFGEEYSWDMLIYRESVHFFQLIWNYPFSPWTSPIGQAVGIALLSLPQVTHYILDGFIWKSNDKNPYLKQVLIQ